MPSSFPNFSLEYEAVHAFHFAPSIPGEYTWIALYSAVSLVIWAQIAFLYGSRFMYIIVVTGILGEVLGYALRVASAVEYDETKFVVTSLCLLIAPIALAFVNYLVAGWLVMAVGRRVYVFCWQVSAPSIAKIFLASDLVCLMLQGTGGAMLAVKNIDIVHVGNAVILTGLCVQLLFFSAYFWIVIKLRVQHEFKLKHVETLRPLFRGLFITVFLMYFRA